MIYESGFLLVVSLFACSYAARTIYSHLSVSDFDRLNKVFADGLKSNDLQSIYYSALNLNQLSESDKNSACNRLLSVHSESKLNVSVIFDSKICQRTIFIVRLPLTISLSGVREKFLLDWRTQAVGLLVQGARQFVELRETVAQQNTVYVS